MKILPRNSPREKSSVVFFRGKKRIEKGVELSLWRCDKIPREVLLRGL